MRGRKRSKDSAVEQESNGSKKHKEDKGEEKVKGSEECGRYSKRSSISLNRKRKDENEYGIESNMCHQCQRNDKRRVVRCTKGIELSDSVFLASPNGAKNFYSIICEVTFFELLVGKLDLRVIR